MVKDSKTGECYRADVGVATGPSFLEAAGGEDGPADEGRDADEGAASGAGAHPSAGGLVHGRPAGRAVCEVRCDGAGDGQPADAPVPVQPDVLYADRSGGHAAGLPASGDGAGHVHELPPPAGLQRAQVPLRGGAGGHGVPQRDLPACGSAARERVPDGGDRAFLQPERQASPEVREGVAPGAAAVLARTPAGRREAAEHHTWGR